jgi:cell division protein FtsA
VADRPTLWLIAGPDGVGKTTYARRYLRAVAGTERFVNLDEIARGFSPLTPTPDAEDIKLRFGVAKQVLASPDEVVEVPGLGDRGPRQVKRQALGAVIEPRVEELFGLVQQVIRESGYEDLLSSGVVLTGGSSMMPGMVELAEDVFLKPVRVAVPEYDGSLADVMRSPRFATVMGLLGEARMQRLRGRKFTQQSGSFKAILARMKEWFTQ